MTKLYRSRRDSKLTGLCGGLAEQLNVDSTLLRLVVVVTTFFSAGTVIPIYIIASIVIPKEPISNIPPMYPPYGGMGSGQGHYSGNPYSQPPGTHSGQYRPQPGYYPGAAAVPQREPAPAPQPAANSIDEMMKDVEKKAMWKEIEELRAKVAKYEKGE
jgi:phage shock protein C